MKVTSLLRTALVVSALLGAHVATAAPHKNCEANPTPKPNPVPVPAPTTGAPVKPVPAPTTGAPVKPVPAPTTGAPGKPTPPPVSAAPVTPNPGNQGPAPGKGGSATNAGSVKASFTYKGADAGGPGSYQMVTDFASCSKTTHVTNSRVSPLDDDVTVVFRGPMTIHNIAVFDGSSGNWNRVSSYAKGGASDNLVFLNNRNIDFGGKSSPQGFATQDGRGKAESATAFSGELSAATNPGGFSIYADEKTGAEVNIFQNKKCGQDGECKGYYDKDGTAHIGWAGGKKIFVTKVHMPHGGAPNLPAVWMLNGQIVRSSQYQCNCRGMGKAGGCGELDIAEVIEKDANVVATHYYLYDGGIGHDSWSKRPVDGPTTYITIIDETFGVKVLEIGADDFDFNAGSLSQDVVSKWESA